MGGRRVNALRIFWSGSRLCLALQVWGSVVLGGLLAAPVVGPFADHFDPQYIFFIAFPFAIQVVFPLLRGYLPEDFVPKERRTIQYGKLRECVDVGAGVLCVLGLVSFVFCGAGVFSVYWRPLCLIMGLSVYGAGVLCVLVLVSFVCGAGIICALNWFPLYLALVSFVFGADVLCVLWCRCSQRVFASLVFALVSFVLGPSVLCVWCWGSLSMVLVVLLSGAGVPH